MSTNSTGEAAGPPAGSASPEPSATSTRLPLTPLTIVAIVAPGFIVFALPMIGHIARNEEFFEGDYLAGRYLYGLGLVTVAIGFGLWSLTATTAGRFLFTCYVLLTPGWILYTALGGWRRAFAGLVVTLLLLVAGLLVVRLGSQRFMNGIGLFAAVTLVATLVTTAIEMQSDGVAGRAAAATPGPGDAAVGQSASLPNVYHIVFDEYQTEMFEAVLDDGLRRALAGFTWYRDARTVYGRTEMSMASVFAPADYDYQATPQDFVDASVLAPDSSLQLIRQAGYTTTAYLHLESLYHEPPPFDESILFKDSVRSSPGSSRVQLASSLWAYSNLPGSLARRLLPKGDYDQLSGQNLLPDDAPPLSAAGLGIFISRERRSAATGRYSLVHLMLPHFPYVLSADCGYEAGSETTPAAQAECAADLMVRLVEELRALDRFDDSTIVLMGDHGARFERTEDGALVQVPSDFFGERWSDARSRSLLLVKPAGVDSTEDLVVSDYPAMLTDVMPTVFDSLGLPFEVGEGRTSLLADELPQRRERYYHFYDKGDDGLPDGEIARYVISDGELKSDTTITVPMP